MAFGGLVTQFDNEGDTSKLPPVGMVSISVFEAARRPCHNPYNIAMIYAVGPDGGGREGLVHRRDVDAMSPDRFLHIVMLTTRSIFSTVAQYNQMAKDSEDKVQPWLMVGWTRGTWESVSDSSISRRRLPEVKVLRMCLISGGSIGIPMSPI